MIILEALGYNDIVIKSTFFQLSLFSFPGLKAINLFARITAGILALCLGYP